MLCHESLESQFRNQGRGGERGGGRGRGILGSESCSLPLSFRVLYKYKLIYEGWKPKWNIITSQTLRLGFTPFSIKGQDNKSSAFEILWAPL